MEAQTYYLRLLSLLGISVLIYWAARPTGDVWVVSIALAGYLAYSVVFHNVVLRRYCHSAIALLMMMVDWLFAAAAMQLLGIASVGFLILPLLVIYHAILAGYSGSLASATVLSFVAVGFAFIGADDPQTISIVAFRIPLLYMVAIFAGYMAQQRFRERDAKLAVQEALRAEQKARDLISVTQQMNQDPEIMLGKVAETAAGVTGALQCLVFVKNATEGYFEARASFPLRAEGGLSSVLGVRLAIRVCRWEENDGDEVSLIVGAQKMGAWASPIRSEKVVGVKLAEGSDLLGLLCCIPFEGQHIDDLKRLASAVAPLAASALAQVERNKKARQQSEELLKGLQGAVQKLGQAREAHGKTTLVRGALALNPGRAQATLGGTQINLSRTEFEVLYYLAQHSGQAVNQATLLREVWGGVAETRSNLVDVCVHRLRKKLGETPGGKDLIVTARGSGYMFRSG